VRRTMALPPHERLPPRALAVLKLLGAGWRAHEIARQLGIAQSTVSTYRAMIRDVAELRTLPEIVAYCWRAGLIS
jgi:DNA-binding NarL/FixJ family response regulator